MRTFDSGDIWGGRDYMDQVNKTDEYMNKCDEIWEHPKISELPKHIAHGNIINCVEKYENRRGV